MVGMAGGDTIDFGIVTCDDVGNDFGNELFGIITVVLPVMVITVLTEVGTDEL